MTQEFTRILVPTDFSAPSNAALEAAKTMAARFGASLHLIHVLEDPFVTAAYAPEIYAAPPAGIKEQWQQGAETLLETQLTPAEHATFRSTVLALFGTPAKAIVEYAAANGIDLIVMGTHGRGGVAHLLMGSVAERVVRTAPCPVLTVRNDGTARQEKTAPIATAAVSVA